MRLNFILICCGLMFASLMLVAPFIDAPQLNNWLFRISSLIMLATSWNLMANVGLVSLGHSAFWGVGCYVAILVANSFEMSFLPSMLVTLAVGASMGLALAQITKKLKGIFFAIATLALSEGLRITAFMMPNVTNGAMGLFLRDELQPSQKFLYFAAALASILCVLVAFIFSKSKLHYASRAMRENEAAAQMVGVNPSRQRIIVVSISGSIASLAGGLNAWYGGYLDPDIAFTLHNTILAQIAPIIGGVHTISGPVIGSAVIIVLSETTRALFGNIEGVSQLTFGLVLVLSVLFLPRGISGRLAQLFRCRTERQSKQRSFQRPS